LTSRVAGTRQVVRDDGKFIGKKFRKGLGHRRHEAQPPRHGPGGRFGTLKLMEESASFNPYFKTKNPKSWILTHILDSFVFLFLY
jgi:hypothetical protein